MRLAKCETRESNSTLLSTRRKLHRLDGIIPCNLESSQAAKLAHMQEFVDRFRYNANRAALVQSRIKSMNKEVIIEDAENDDTDGFNFQFADAGDLGRNVIQIEGASFGYLKPEVAAARKKLEAELLAKQQAQ
jgi:ATPase subunit of ABC transporter with duplicated ATPase domains